MKLADQAASRHNRTWSPVQVHRQRTGPRRGPGRGSDARVRSRRAPVAPDADATLQRLVDRAAGREPSGPRPPDAGYGDIVEAARHTTTRPAASSASVAFAPMVQRTTGSRTCTCGATEPCSCADLDHPVQRQGAGDVATVAARDVAPSGPGRPLEPGIRAEFEHSFDHDFSDVRIHTGASAANAARTTAGRSRTRLCFTSPTDD